MGAEPEIGVANDVGSAAQPTLSVIIPTIGRRSLRFSLESVKGQTVGCPTVEVIVAADGSQPAARAIFDRVSAGAPCWRYLETEPTRASGNAQREEGMREARGRYLMFLDDDDVYLPAGLTRVVEAISEHPGRIVLLRVDRFGELWWKTREIRQGKIGAGNLVVPNIPGKLGSWIEPASTYVSDYQFISQTVALQGEPLWVDEVMTICDQPYWLPWRRKRSNALTRAVDRLRTRARLRTRLRAAGRRRSRT